MQRQIFFLFRYGWVNIDYLLVKKCALVGLFSDAIADFQFDLIEPETIMHQYIHEFSFFFAFTYVVPVHIELNYPELDPLYHWDDTKVPVFFLRKVVVFKLCDCAIIQ